MTILGATATLPTTEFSVEETVETVTVCVELVEQLERNITVELTTGAEDDTATGIIIIIHKTLQKYDL